jgi:hypothetical protein
MASVQVRFSPGFPLGGGFFEGKYDEIFPNEGGIFYEKKVTLL